MAAIVNVIMADRLLGGHDSLPMPLVVCEETGALATAYMLIKGRAHSPMMQFNHTQALNMPQFVGMLPHLSVSHITGLANLASDAASNAASIGKFEALHSLARQLGVIAVEVQVPSVALDLLHNTVRELEKLHESVRTQSFRWTSTEMGTCPNTLDPKCSTSGLEEDPRC